MLPGLSPVARLYRQRHFVAKVLASRMAAALGTARRVDAARLEGWAPFVVRKHYVVWVDMRGQRLKSGLVERDFLRAARRSGSVRTTDLDTLDRTARLAVQPSGFVFHVSRCGSTLLQNMLATTPQALSLGEPIIVNHVLNADLPRERKVVRLTGTIKSLCHSYVDETRYFIKFSSSCSMHLGLMHDCFPDTPMIFLYRDPVEVMVACVQEGGSNWTRARSNPAHAERLTGIDRRIVAQSGVEEYAARTIGNYLERACAQAGPIVPINYSRLLEPETLEAICRVCRIEDPDAAVARMKTASGKNAKKRNEDFVPDSERRRDRASPKIRDAAERWCSEAYQRIERLSESRLREVLAEGCASAPRLVHHTPTYHLA